MNFKSIIRSAFIFVFLCSSTSSFSADSTYYEVWELNSLEEIGGHTLTVKGDPEVVETEIGAAIQFDGIGDQLLIDSNPIGDSKEYTVEVIFKPDNGNSISPEPRFIHIQDPDDPEAKRVMIEIRLTSDGLWYLDGFMNTDNDNLTLIDDTKTHPTEEWMHAAITYKDNTFKTYVNGVEELSGSVGFASEILNPTGKTSIGARMNERNYYPGLVKTLKITRAVLNPADFMQIPEIVDPNSITSIEDAEFEIYPNPASDLIRLSSKKSALAIDKIKLFNCMGSEVKVNVSQYSAHKITLPTSNLKNGLYFVQIRSKEQQITKRVVIQH